MKKFKISLLLLLTCLLVVVSACSNSDKAASEKKKMQFFVSGDNVEGAALATMSKKYSEETGVEIEVVDVPFNDMVTRITNMVQAGNPPALARTAGFNPIWRDSLADLSATLSDKNLREDLAIKDDGKVKGLPLDLTAVGLYINKDLFDKAGVKYPTTEEDVWTWDEFRTALETVIEKTDAKYGLVMDQSEHRLSTLLYQFGSKGFYEENGQYTTNAETKKALNYFVKLNDDKIMPKAVWSAGEDPSSMFKSGQVAAYYSGVWQIKDFEKNIKNFEWASVYMPYEKVRATNLGGNYIVKFEGSGVEKEAQKFIDWLYTKENYEELASLGGYLPVVADAKVDYAVGEQGTKSYEVYRNEMKASDPIAAKLKAELDVLQLTSEKTANNAIRDNVVKTLNGEQSVEDTIKNVNEKLTDAYVK
ncbi:sugar ABC transporter substrate-binding protein [Peribacillus muralis]|uniref:ABC transporter substrate-binding protein n=1 Tax=Peribacillus muralis TaxID=264697 RepID=UPI001F4E25DE|nr:sugar ABC transporter substrate-binding protein [Peribacillus muralis]MCK2014168.1 sugar ABC transporter substrate-binding protein [Peribacillus muralis]